MAHMNYRSTRGGLEPLTFRQAFLTGMARDGGLLLPTSYPRVEDRFEAWSTLPYPELAFEVMRLFADDLPEPSLRSIVERSYAVFDHPEVAPLRPLGTLHLLELFHGPTLAFKDIALQFLGNLFEVLLEESDESINLLAATSGDTGSAAIHGVRGRRRQRIFVLHPRGRVSTVQALQMTTVADANVHNLAIDGTFDDCQNIVKTLFRDLPFRDAHRLGAVNSINWARVLAQVVYYFHAGLRVLRQSGAERLRFCVPTGNFGDIFAGYVAWRMGLPIDKLILATNENDILDRFFSSGEYRRSAVESTLSPSMDIQIASNFERYLFHRADDRPERVRDWMRAFESEGVLQLPAAGDGPVDPLFLSGSADRRATLDTIRRHHEREGVLLDPHTAVGVAVAERFADPSIPTICLATAHPAKFPEAIAEATGCAGLALHPSIEALKDLPRRLVELPADLQQIADHVHAATTR